MIALVWLVILPRVGAIPSVKAYIDKNEANGIDPGVRFYSELPCMPEMIHRVDTVRRQHGEQFWKPSTKD